MAIENVACEPLSLSKKKKNTIDFLKGLLHYGKENVNMLFCMYIIYY